MSMIYKIVLTVVVAAMIVSMYYIQVKSTERVIIEAVNKPLTEIRNEFDKIKVKKDGTVALDLTNTATSVTDSVSVGFWKKLFGKK